MNLLSKKTLGIISVLIAALLWSASGLLVKSIDANPVFIVFGRSLVAAALLFPAIKFKKLKFNKNLIILGLAYTSCLTSFVVSTKLTAAANAITLQYTAPFFLFIGLWVFKKELLSLLHMIKDMSENHNCQFIISTHSPILLAYDKASIYSLDNETKKLDWQELESVQLLRDFLNAPNRYIDKL